MVVFLVEAIAALYRGWILSLVLECPWSLLPCSLVRNACGRFLTILVQLSGVLITHSESAVVHARSFKT